MSRLISLLESHLEALESSQVYDDSASLFDDLIRSCRAIIVEAYRETGLPLPSQALAEHDRETATLPSFLVGDRCMESYPCQHNVSLADGSLTRMNGRNIAKLYQAENIVIPAHFAKYVTTME